MTILDIDNVILMKIDDSIREIYPKLKDKLGSEGLTRIQNNELGQEVKHYHMHLVPRYKDDKFIENREKSKNIIESKIINLIISKKIIIIISRNYFFFLFFQI